MHRQDFKLMAKRNPKTLDTFITSQTTMSRREIIPLLKRQAITLNGHTISALKHPMTTEDILKIDGKHIRYTTPFVYYKYYKPKGIICSCKDPKDRRDIRYVIHKHRLPPSVRPVGRLDRQTTGLLLLTNDGQFTQTLCHPSHHMEKHYSVTTAKPYSPAMIKKLQLGLTLSDGPVHFKAIYLISPTQLQLVIEEGRNRIIRRCFEHLNCTIKHLKRLRIGPFELGKLTLDTVQPFSAKELKWVDKLV